MSKIVADADGLIKLGKSGVLGCLLSATEVLVPRAVYREAVDAGKKEMHEDAFELEKVLSEGGVEVVEDQQDGRAEKLLEGVTSLGVGERATLHVLFAREADAVLTDDRAFLNLLGRARIRTLVPAAAIVSLFETDRLRRAKAIEALGRIEGLLRHEVYEAAMEGLIRPKEPKEASDR
jgi:predicted nucleic acid-binding protein